MGAPETQSLSVSKGLFLLLFATGLRLEAATDNSAQRLPARPALRRSGAHRRSVLAEVEAVGGLGLLGDRLRGLGRVLRGLRDVVQYTGTKRISPEIPPSPPRTMEWRYLQAALPISARSGGSTCKPAGTVSACKALLATEDAKILGSSFSVLGLVNAL